MLVLLLFGAAVRAALVASSDFPLGDGGLFMWSPPILPRMATTGGVAGLRRVDDPLAPTLLTAVAAAIFLGWVLLSAGGDVSRLVHAGDRYSDPSVVPAGLAVERGAGGYDGQFYYRLALDPFSTQVTEHGITLDGPAYRQRRILYALIVRAVTLGDPGAVPLGMVLVNYVGLCAIAWAAGRYAQSFGAHALWGVIVPLYPGLLVTLSRDLTEIVALAFLLFGLLLFRSGRIRLAAILLTLAVLARETAIVVVATLFLIEARGLSRAVSRRGRVLALALPFAALAAWQAILLLVWGPAAATSGGANLAPPLTGIVGALRAGPGRPEDLLLWSALYAFLAASVLIVALQFTRTAARIERVLWLGAGLLAASLAAQNWTPPAAWLRQLADLFALGALVVIGSPLFARIGLLTLTVAFWLLVGLLRAGFD